jgi:hypothetical protein
MRLIQPYRHAHSSFLSLNSHLFLNITRITIPRSFLRLLPHNYLEGDRNVLFH